MKRLSQLFYTALLFSTPLIAESAPAKYIESLKTDSNGVRIGKAGSFTVQVKMVKGLHVQANPAAMPNLKPTLVVIGNQAGFEFLPATYPEGKPYRMLNAAQDISVYEGSFEIKVPFRAVNPKPGKQEVKGELKYQACNDKICFFPRTEPITVSIMVYKG